MSSYTLPSGQFLTQLDPSSTNPDEHKIQSVLSGPLHIGHA